MSDLLAGGPSLTSVAATDDQLIIECQVKSCHFLFGITCNEQVPRNSTLIECQARLGLLAVY